MANLKVNNYDNLKLRINLDEYWDFYVNKDSYGSFRINGLYDNCLISYIDLCDSACTDGSEWVYSKSEYTWDKSTAIDYTLYNISYLGVDNGLFQFRKDRISNKDFVKIFQENKFKIAENDFRLKLHAVSGNTLQYEYPIHFEECYAKFNGGFLQGFFETECDKYQVLPSHFDDGDVYNFEFTLKRCDLEKESDKTLNDKYPNNKGIFFYLGTRAENKWIYEYDKKDEDGLEACYELGVDDFVEDGEIDKKKYIIGNFYKPNPDFEGYDPFELGDYTNYNYYDESLYDDDPCDWADMSDYLEIDYRRKPNIIDENEPHTTLTWCCGNVNDNSSVRPWFHGCGCHISYKKAKKVDNNTLNGCDEFGDDYIVDNGELMSLDEARDYIEAELNIEDFEYYSDNGFNLSEANWYYFYTDNKFLFFDRTKTGKTVSNWVEGTQFMFSGRRSKFKGNLFILMNRTKTGYTVSNIDLLRDQSANEYNPYSDIYDNAFALRITDNGEIGYRLLTKDCGIDGRDKSSIIEGYSFENVIPNCEWVTVNVRMTFLGGDKMKLMFYVNGKLKYVTKELPRINMRALNELYEKQEGVPYNISIGGGTQGLAETIQRNYMLNPTRVYPLEQNFAGSFIGYISSFKIYNCMLEKMIIEHNYNYEKIKL
jgi:hypothetical protein